MMDMDMGMRLGVMMDPRRRRIGRIPRTSRNSGDRRRRRRKRGSLSRSCGSCSLLSTNPGFDVLTQDPTHVGSEITQLVEDSLHVLQKKSVRGCPCAWDHGMMLGWRTEERGGCSRETPAADQASSSADSDSAQDSRMSIPARGAVDCVPGGGPRESFLRQRMARGGGLTLGRCREWTPGLTAGGGRGQTAHPHSTDDEIEFFLFLSFVRSFTPLFCGSIDPRERMGEGKERKENPRTAVGSVCPWDCCLWTSGWTRDKRVTR